MPARQQRWHRRLPRFLSALAAVALLACPAAGAAPEPTREVIFNAADGVRLHGDLYLGTEPKSGPVILLFHQAGANARAEYAPLAGRLTEKGYNLFAIDQRVGGSRLGGENRTVAGLGGKEYSYCEAMPDLEAALDYLDAQGYTGAKAVWGSSYSAALVLSLAAARGSGLKAVLAFSPASGGPLAECRGEDVAAEVKIPVLVMRPESEMALESSQAQRDIFINHGFDFYVAPNGVHGSSMLNPARVEGNVEGSWRVVLEFLAKHLPAREPGAE
jgi:dienelactone hydrolase